MKERIKTAIKFLKDNQAFFVEGIRLNAEESGVLEVSGWSHCTNFSSLTKQQSLKEFEEIKILFYKMLEISQDLKKLTQKKLVKFNLCFDDYGKGSILICSQKYQEIKWEITL